VTGGTKVLTSWMGRKREKRKELEFHYHLKGIPLITYRPPT
jgi:hypothetical protein